MQLVSSSSIRQLNGSSMITPFDVLDVLFSVRIVEIQYKAVPSVRQSVKKIVKKSRRPEGRSEKAMQEEQLLNALRSHITVGQSSSNEFQFERT